MSFYQATVIPRVCKIKEMFLLTPSYHYHLQKKNIQFIQEYIRFDNGKENISVSNSQEINLIVYSSVCNIANIFGITALPSNMDDV